ncbi:MAG: hypothetical protein WCP28_10710 [Actinomycetes bacterium]
MTAKGTPDPWASLKAKIEAQQGLAEVTLGELRAAAGYGKLGRYVLDEIRNKLAGEGLGAFPATILDYETNAELSQTQAVRIYKQGSPVGKIVAAIERPSRHGDAWIRRVANEDAGEKLAQIRALVCDES